MREFNEFKEALQRMELSTARGRRELEGREISWKPAGDDIKYAALDRVSGYISIAKNLREVVMAYHDGITAEELESVEFVMEQLEALSRKAHETAIKNY